MCFPAENLEKGDVKSVSDVPILYLLTLALSQLKIVCLNIVINKDYSFRSCVLSIFYFLDVSTVSMVNHHNVDVLSFYFLGGEYVGCLL